MPGDKYGYSLDVGKDLEEKKQKEDVEEKGVVKSDAGTRKTAKEVEEEIKKDLEEAEEIQEGYEDVVFKDAETDRQHIDKLKKEVETSSEREEITEIEEEVEDIINSKKKTIGEEPKEKNEVFEFLKKYQVFIFLLIVLVSSFVVLTQPQHLKVIDQRAEEAAHLELKRTVSLEVEREWPLLPIEEKLKKTNQRLLPLLKSKEVKSEIERISKINKDYYRDSFGNTYLFKADPYSHIRQARNLIENGHIGTEIREGKYFDSLRTAPGGMMVDPKLLPYLEVYFFKALNLFSNFSLEKSTFYLPVFLGLLSAVLFFFIAKRLTNTVSAFFASFLLSIHPLFFSGTFAGYTDTQSLSMLFILLSMFLFVYGIGAKNKLVSFLLFLLLIPALMLFKFAWNGWFYILFILLLFTFVYIITKLLRRVFVEKERKSIKYLAFVVLVLIVLFFYFKNSPYAISISTTLRSATSAPSIITVSEVQAVTLKELIGAFGGVLLGLIVLFEVLYLIFKNIKKPDKYQILVLIWFIPTLIVGIMSRRYLFFLAPSFMLLIGYFLHQIVPYFVGIIRAININLSERKVKILFVIMIPLILLFLMSEDIVKARKVLPDMDDAIYETAEFVRENSMEDAVINTWWDLGYMWQYYAMRGTSIDGSTFGDYWTARALITDDERIAKSLLRVVNCGKKDVVFNNVRGLTNAEIEERILAGRESASKFAEERGLDKDFFNYIHCDSPAEAYLIISEDMRDKISTIAYFAQSELGSEVEQFALSRTGNCFMMEGLLHCDNSYIINIENLDARSNNLHPGGLIIYNNGIKEEVVYEDSTAPFTIIVYATDNGFKSFLIDSSLKESMLVRLFAQDQFDNFELVHKVEQPDRILTYKILWEEKEASKKESSVKGVEETPEEKMEEVEKEENEGKELSEILIEGLKD